MGCHKRLYFILFLPTKTKRKQILALEKKLSQLEAQQQDSYSNVIDDKIAVLRTDFNLQT